MRYGRSGGRGEAALAGRVRPRVNMQLSQVWETGNMRLCAALLRAQPQVTRRELSPAATLSRHLSASMRQPAKQARSTVTNSSPTLAQAPTCSGSTLPRTLLTSHLLRHLLLSTQRRSHLLGGPQRRSHLMKPDRPNAVPAWCQAIAGRHSSRHVAPHFIALWENDRGGMRAGPAHASPLAPSTWLITHCRDPPPV